MRKGLWLPVLAVSGLLGGCGGGGGDDRPAVTPPPPPPPPPVEEPPSEPEPPAGPETIHDLQKNHSFTGSAAFSTFPISTATGEAGHGQASSGPLTVSYNAQSKSYTVAAKGYSQTFRPADIDDASTEEFTAYVKEYEAGNEQLLLVKTSLDGVNATKYAAMGLWQRNSFANGQIDAEFDTFVYGFDAPASAIPRSGGGSFKIDVFGMRTQAGFEPLTFYGIGRFDVDFKVGVFSTHTFLTEDGVFSGHTDSGTGFELVGTGKLSGTDGTFSGQILYSGAGGQMPGTLNGRFYGPDASELGATFSSINGAGAGGTVSGAMLGWQDSGTPRVNLTLTNMVRPELISTDHAHMHAGTGEPVIGDSQLFLQPDGSLEFSSSISGLRSVALTPEARVASADPNFTAYEKTTGGQTVRLEMYKTGQGNTELPLTYASFGQWQSAPEGSPLAEGDRVFFVYGLRTPAGILWARTGSAHYAGVVHGAAFNTETNARYAVSGTSRFDVNFSTTVVSGDLTLAGTPGGAPRVDFGKYDFGGSMGRENRFLSSLWKEGHNFGTVQVGFYGPNGEEIAGSFQMTVPNSGSSGVTSITGVTVATQR